MPIAFLYQVPLSLIYTLQHLKNEQIINFSFIKHYYHYINFKQQNYFNYSHMYNS